MMKCLHKHIARMAAALCLLPVSCVKEMPFQEEGPSGALYLQPGAVELTTKTAGDDDRGENALGTYLDVFFTGNGHSFWKEYHLTDRSFASAKGELLSVNWRADGFDPEKSYKVYVLVNGPDAAHGTVGSLDALRAITVTDADIYRLQWKTGDRAKEEPHAYTSGAKRFVMDGYRGSWSPDGNKTVQTIDMSASLRRAAAKIVLNVSYDADFLTEIIADEKTPQEPRFKLNNYAACSAAITDGDAVDPAIATTGGWRRLNGYVEPAPDPVYNYSLTTYSYAFSWGTSAAAVGLDAPYIILSVPLGDDPAKVVNHYYRIPVRPQNVPQNVYSLERNTIYTINVVLNSLGSYKEADAEIPVNLSYQVLEWTKIGSEVTNVETEAVHFFQVSPTEVALRGDGAQSQTFRYYAPTDASITIEAIPTDPTNELDAEATARSFTDTQTTTVGGHGYQALYIDKDGTPRASSVKSITVNTTAGTITVTSTALANRASKYIRFRVWYDKGETWQEYQDIYIRHFPTDNISSISGWYSYKYDGSTKREYSWNPVTDGWFAEGWDKWEDYTDEYCPDRSTYDNAYHNNNDMSSAENRVASSDTPNWREYIKKVVPRYEFVTAVDNDPGGIAFAGAKWNRDAGSEEEAVEGSGDYSRYWYWGGPSYTIISKVWTSRPDEDDYDWATVGWGTLKLNFYTWTDINKYWYVKGSARRYYRDVPDYSWVRWIPDSQTNYTGTKITGDSYMNAKVYENGEFHRINAPANGRATLGATTTHKNNHMYVIQLTASSENYVMGRPIINTSTHFSDDHVVSPAFMLASQLGACDAGELGNNPDVAATHCAQYVEASKISSTTSKVYTGWRLPTDEELTIIKNIQDQNYDTFDKVISVGNYYFTLEGSRHAIGAPADKPGHFVRCVRDLTPEELTELNKVK